MLLWFYAPWSRPCLQAAPALESGFWQTYRTRRLVVVGLGLKETTESVRKFRDDQRITFRVGRDLGAALFNSFRQEGVPLHVLLDADRNILLVSCGFDEALLTAKIREALGE